MSKSHLIVGAPHQGKSTYIKKRLELVPNSDAILVYDVQKEYYGISKKTDEPFEKLYDPKYKLPEFPDFCEKITRMGNGVIVLEEATIFLDPRGSNFDLRNFLISRYHNGNYIFLCFHSLRAIPFWVFNYSDYLTLFKTNDSLRNIEQRFQNEKINNAFQTVKRAAKYSHVTLSINEL